MPNSSNSHVLVTGGSGFLGQFLIESLLNRGFSVSNFDIQPATNADPRSTFKPGDIREPEEVLEACCDVDFIIHAIAQQPLEKDTSTYRSVNYEGTRNLLSAARKHRVSKVVFLSSTAVYGIPKSLPISEDTALDPVERYGRSKAETEKLCRDFIAQGLDVSIIRPRTIIGHGRLGIFQLLFEWIYQGEAVPVLGDGKNLFQFIHARDLADAIIRAAERPGSSAYNIGTDRFGTIREMLESLCAHAGTGAVVKSLPRRPAIWANRLLSACGLSPLGVYHYLAYGYSSYFDISLAKEELGWEPSYSNDEMLIESYDWYVQNRDMILSGETGASPNSSAVKEKALRFGIRCLKWF